MSKNSLIIGLLFLLISSCGKSEKSNEESADERIVSAAKQYTEIMYALGVGDQLVGVDLSNKYPPKVQELPTVGYHMHLSFEGIMSLEPTMLLHKGGNFDIGPEKVVWQLKKMDLKLKTFNTDATDIPSTKKLIQEMGGYFNKEAQADSLSHELDADMKKAKEKRKQYDHQPKVVAIHYGRALNVFFTIGKGSTAGKMIQWAGGKNPIDKDDMGRITSPEVIAKANPDVILITGVGYDKLGSMEQIKQLPGVGLTDAAKNDRIYRIAVHDLKYLGPRTGESVMKIQKLIHQKSSQS